MAEKIRILIQIRHTPELRAALKARKSLASNVSSLTVPGLHVDEGYTPVQVPSKKPRDSVGPTEVGRLFTYDFRPDQATYLIRGEVEDEDTLNKLMKRAAEDPNIVGIFSDPVISAIAVCPSGPIGNHEDVKQLLKIPSLTAQGMDGKHVLVAIVDTGINLDYLRNKGLDPGFDSEKSWTPIDGLTPGNIPVDHGTMCAFDVCLSAPSCTLLDFALLQSRTSGGSIMDGFLSDAVKAYSKLLDLMLNTDPKPALVVNNSWGMFHPSWDFPPDHPGNYSDNPDHPFNIIVESLEDAGADILFAAGNCGRDCPDPRCKGATERPIYGANSHPSVLCVAGCTINKIRVGYSSQGPGHLEQNKPDITAYTHFRGSGVYSADSGTSAACPVAAGVIAAIRTRYGLDKVSPSQLRNIVRRSAEDLGLIGFDYDHGYGLINPTAIVETLEQIDTRIVHVGELVSGRLKRTGDTALFKIPVGNALNIELDGPQGVDFDIYVKKDAPPTVTDYDYRGFTGSADEKIRIEPVEPGEYYVMVRSYRGAGDFSLKAVLE